MRKILTPYQKHWCGFPCFKRPGTKISFFAGRCQFILISVSHGADIVGKAWCLLKTSLVFLIKLFGYKPAKMFGYLSLPSRTL